jgi:uncharacterized protein YeaC (DUF1315 family)
MSEYLNDRSVPKILEAGAKTYKERHDMYGDNYKRFGKILMELFPEGIHITNAEEASCLNLLIQIQGKITRYAEMLSIGRGGHVDSAHDACVYAAMLESITDEKPF